MCLGKPVLFGYLRASGPLRDAEDDELGGLHRRDADQDDQPAVVYIVLGHGGAVALDEEGFLRRRAHQRAVAPQAHQEAGDVALDRLPERDRYL